MMLKHRYLTLGLITALGITSQNSHQKNSARSPANSVSPVRVQNSSKTSSVRENKEQIITKIGSDHPSIQGKPLWVSAVAKDTELSSIKYSKGDIPIQKINEQGVSLFKYNLLGSNINIVKLRRGWPTDANSKDENPAIAPKTTQLNSKGGKITLSYLSELNLLSKNKYKHLTLEIIQEGNGFKLITANSSTANFLFATSQDNKQGLRSIEPVSPSRFAVLTGQHVIEDSPRVASRQSSSKNESKEASNPSNQSESVTAKDAGESMSRSAE